MPTRPRRGRRLDSVDALRGVIMVLMVLDHTRDFFFGGPKPTDLSQSWPALFFTRWITHLCAPGFLLLAGLAVFLAMDRAADERARAERRRFVFKRGLYLALLEITVVRLGWVPDPFYRWTLVQVIWAIGWSMMLLSPLTLLSPRTVGIVGLAIVAGHDLLNGVQPEDLGAWSWLWVILHGKARLYPTPEHIVFINYSIVPWCGLMAVGYGFGSVFTRWRNQPERIAYLGAGVLVLFAVVRGLNGYGNPAPWSEQPTAVGTVMSFLNAQKYPASLSFVAMTSGVLLLLLAAFVRHEPKLASRLGPLITFGRVPLFFYLAHLFMLRALSIAVAYALVGDRAFMRPPDGTGLSPQLGLGAVWLVFALALPFLYGLCRWFDALKARRDDWWLSYV